MPTNTKKPCGCGENDLCLHGLAAADPNADISDVQDWRQPRGPKTRECYEHHAGNCYCIDPAPESADDIPAAIRAEVMRAATENGRISYWYLCGLWRRGRRFGRYSVHGPDRYIATLIELLQRDCHACGDCLVCEAVLLLDRMDETIADLLFALKNWQNYDLTLEQRQNAATDAIRKAEGIEVDDAE